MPQNCQAEGGSPLGIRQQTGEAPSTCCNRDSIRLSLLRRSLIVAALSFPATASRHGEQIFPRNASL